MSVGKNACPTVPLVMLLAFPLNASAALSVDASPAIRAAVSTPIDALSAVSADARVEASPARFVVSVLTDPVSVLSAPVARVVSVAIAAFAAAKSEVRFVTCPSAMLGISLAIRVVPEVTRPLYPW